MCWGEAEQKYETCGRGKTLGAEVRSVVPVFTV